MNSEASRVATAAGSGRPRGRCYSARADDFPDALAGGTLTDGPVLLVPRCSALPSAVVQEIRRVDPQQVVALGGTDAVCPAVLEAAANA